MHPLLNAWSAGLRECANEAADEVINLEGADETADEVADEGADLDGARRYVRSTFAKWLLQWSSRRKNGHRIGWRR